ncbi:major facilitator superfamily domain-containing protein [Rhodocollybia butyracea]|uniref:Major facilitator superfamily domain-containing protein n=1 Tax=Rhodocollybia butyracea TaxID=206335 RepID=A0A9P5PHY6_9AGAR|nr:major facilitator superfamily domain-containing protein [Rhodocollybia butyracea]
MISRPQAVTRERFRRNPERFQAERRLLRKLDMRVMPTIVLIYIMNYIDRNAVTTARLKGLEQDLGLTDLQYNVVLSILYVSYCPAQIPSNMELAFRSAILFGGLLISNAFGSVGPNISGITFKWLLPDYPVNTRWMSSQERRLAQARLADDAGEADQDTIGDSSHHGRKGSKVWVFSIMTTAQLLGLSSISFFPTLTATLGFNTTVTLLLAAPPWILATIVCGFNAWHADRTGERFFHQSGWWWGVLVAFIISLSTNNIAARYVSLFLMACGNVAFSMTLVWVSNTFPRPPAKRAAIIAIVNGIGNLGNLMGSYTWKSEWGPAYHQSMIISFVSLVFATVLALILRQWIIRDNKKLDADEKVALSELNHTRVEEAARLEGITLEQAMQRRKGFRYLY